jgi:hypothetical protein
MRIVPPGGRAIIYGAVKEKPCSPEVMSRAIHF